MIVRAYRANKYSLRITVPKSIYETFAQVYSSLGAVKGGGPCLCLRIGTDTPSGIKPYFDNCDFGLEMYLGQPNLDNQSSVGMFGKSNMGFTLNAKTAARIGVVEGMKLQCEILENRKPSMNCYQKIIGYKIV